MQSRIDSEEEKKKECLAGIIQRLTIVIWENNNCQTGYCLVILFSSRYLLTKVMKEATELHAPELHLPLISVERESCKSQKIVSQIIFTRNTTRHQLMLNNIYDDNQS